MFDFFYHKTDKFPSYLLLFREVYYNMSRYRSEIYLLNSLPMSKYFTVEIFPSIIIYKQRVFLGQICLQEFSQSACYLHTFKHCLCQWNKISGTKIHY